MAFTDNIKEITPAIADIKNNTPVLIVDDKVLVGGIGGNFIPAGQGGGGSTTSMDFYKCAAVNSDSTWSGYKAVLNQQGYYEFEQPATTGLDYGDLVPVIGHVYTNRTLIEISNIYTGIPRDYVFYAPLIDTSITNGQTLTNNNVTFVSNSGFPHDVAYFNGTSSYLSANVANVPSGASPRTFAAWIKPISIDHSACIMGVSSGPNSGMLSILSCSTPNKIYWSSFQDYGPNITTTIDLNQWIHLVGCVSETDFSFYINGVLIDSISKGNLDTQAGTVQIGAINWNGMSRFFYGYIAEARIYARALSSAEIALLASEFTPTSN